MLRLLGLLFLLAASVYGDGFGLCSCPPSVAVVVNGVNYSDSFIRTDLPGGQQFLIDGTVNHIDELNPANSFSFTLHARTNQDTDIDFDTSISGDPTVAFIITQPFLGFGSFALNSTSAGRIQDLSGDGAASVFGSPFIQSTLLNTSIVDQLNTGCNASGLPGFTLDCPPRLNSLNSLFLPPPDPGFPPVNTMSLKIGFSLSNFDGYILTGGTTLTPTPEPAMVIPMVGVLLGMGGLAWRRRRKV